MISYITADEQRRIRSEVEQASRIVQQVLLLLNPLEPTDERVLRTEQALSALERVLWTMTSGPGRLGPAVKVRAILGAPIVPLASRRAPELPNERSASFARRQPSNPAIRLAMEVQSAHA